MEGLGAFQCGTGLSIGSGPGSASRCAKTACAHVERWQGILAGYGVLINGALEVHWINSEEAGTTWCGWTKLRWSETWRLKMRSRLTECPG